MAITRELQPMFPGMPKFGWDDIGKRFQNKVKKDTNLPQEVDKKDKKDPVNSWQRARQRMSNWFKHPESVVREVAQEVLAENGIAEAESVNPQPASSLPKDSKGISITTLYERDERPEEIKRLQIFTPDSSHAKPAPEYRMTADEAYFRLKERIQGHVIYRFGCFI